MWHGHCQRNGAKESAEIKTMKKFLASVLSLVIIAMAAMPAAAQTRSRSCRVDRTRSAYRTDNYRYNRDRRYENYQYRNDDYRYDNDDWEYEDRSVWERHRDKITTAAGAGGGAAIGGMFGGKKGAIIGAIAGGAGAAIYTYKIRDKYRRY
jgi:hypothetical protein